jgi:hypothetical protein
VSRTPTHNDYLKAATVLWGDAGAFLVNEYARHNHDHFDGQLPPIPIVIGMTPYGRCVGQTRRIGDWAAGELPRITIASTLFAAGTTAVSDTVLHEMIHVKLMLAGLDPKHNARPWCDEITRLSPGVLGHEIDAAPVLPRRINGGPSTRLARPGHLTRQEIASWPGPRPGGDVYGVATS